MYFGGSSYSKFIALDTIKDFIINEVSIYIRYYLQLHYIGPHTIYCENLFGPNHPRYPEFGIGVLCTSMLYIVIYRISPFLSKN